MDHTPFNLFCSIPLSCAELGKALQAHVAGKVTAIGDPAYEDLRRALVWNEPAPGRRPTLICRAATEHDVMAAVDFARAHRLKVAVRGGGHNWVGFSLRDHSLLIDLGELKRVISIDAKAHTATVQPAVRGRELNAALAKSGFAFPVGHRPTVPLSGFLLNGGLGCNFGGWGPGCLSIEAANVVTADGRLVVASDTRHPDLLWAIRGAGPGFFGVITQYRLKTRPTPRAITACDYFYAMERMDAVGAWAASIAGKMPKEVELTLFCTAAPRLWRCRRSRATDTSRCSRPPPSPTRRPKPQQRSRRWRAAPPRSGFSARSSISR
jgi:FAD/FMN-containing dehydrogenase